jgi:DinB superfamily
MSAKQREGVNADRSLREHLKKLLGWNDAHAGFDAAVGGIAPGARGVAPEGLPHSAWQIVEHLRRAQHDILDFCRNPKYVELSFPADYWPASAAPPSEAAWKESLAAFRRDRDELKKLADDTTDLFARIPHGTGQTYLRELLLVADHNAYHVGQLIMVRQALGDWKGQ